LDSKGLQRFCFHSWTKIELKGLRLSPKYRAIADVFMPTLAKNVGLLNLGEN